MAVIANDSSYWSLAMTRRKRLTRYEFEQLPIRDQAIVHDLATVRLLTGGQIERLHFSELTGRSRGSARRRTMQRLSSLGLVTTLERRIGGERAGSAGLVYTLDGLGHTVTTPSESGRIRRPWAIGTTFVAHTLDVAELYVRLREREVAGTLKLATFAAEPLSWHITTLGTLKPDAYAVWQWDGWEHHRWIEVDRATESLPTIRRKVLRCRDVANAGDAGPQGILPPVIVTVPTETRKQAVEQVIATLPAPALDYVSVQLFDNTAAELTTLTVRPPP